MPSEPVKAKLNLCSHIINCALSALRTRTRGEGHRRAVMGSLGLTCEHSGPHLKVNPQKQPSSPTHPSLLHLMSFLALYLAPTWKEGKRKEFWREVPCQHFEWIKLCAGCSTTWWAHSRMMWTPRQHSTRHSYHVLLQPASSSVPRGAPQSGDENIPV